MSDNITGYVRQKGIDNVRYPEMIMQFISNNGGVYAAFERRHIHVESISRLGRSTKDLLNIIDTLTDKGVTLVSHKENIDTNTPSGKFMLTVFAALSQLEREQLKQRQREGIEIAKTQGKYTGRKPITIDWSKFEMLYGEWKTKRITGRDFMRRMDLSANTFHRRMREYEMRNSFVEPTTV